MDVRSESRAGSAPAHHAVIAGTGRAGTSFLVRFLEACGLDVGSRNGWSDRARAGMEHFLLDAQTPYVVKDPWLFTYCHEVDPADIEIDALIVPVRELMAAATSRVFQERIAHVERGWHRRPATDVSASAIAGVIYSLEPLDQARILAVGFYRLVHWAMTREVPLYLLEFPRLVDDRDYLVSSLWPWLQTHCTLEQARTAFDLIADPSAVRINASVAEQTPAGSVSANGGALRAAQLDREAMALLLDERAAATHGQLSAMEKRLVHAEHALGSTQSRLAETERALESTQSRLAETENTLKDTQGRLAETQCGLDETHGQLTETEHILDRTYQLLAAAQHEADAMKREADAMKRTVSWRATKPLRLIRSLTR